MRLIRAIAARSLAFALYVLAAIALAVPAHANPQSATVLDLIAGQKNLTTFASAVKTAGLESELSGNGPVTVFAPTDDAFKKLPADQRDALLAPAGRDRLRALLLSLIVRERVQLHDGDTSLGSGRVASAGNRPIVLDGDGGRVTIDGAATVATDMAAKNGLVTTLDHVPLL